MDTGGRVSNAGQVPKKRSSVVAFSDAGGDTQDAGRFDEDDAVADPTHGGNISVEANLVEDQPQRIV